MHVSVIFHLDILICSVANGHFELLYEEDTIIKSAAVGEALCDNLFDLYNKLCSV